MTPFPPFTYSKTYQVDPPNTCGGYTNLEKGVQMDRRKQFPVGGLWPSSPRKIMKLRSSKMDFRHSETKSACYNVYFFHLGVSTEPPEPPCISPRNPHPGKKQWLVAGSFASRFMREYSLKAVYRHYLITSHDNVLYCTLLDQVTFYLITDVKWEWKWLLNY